MSESSDTTEVALLCGRCRAPLRASRYVRVEGSSVSGFCSEDCFRAALEENRIERSAARRRHATILVASVALLAASLAPHQGRLQARARASVPAQAAALAPGRFGPAWPPTEASWLLDLGHDAWIHPLAGPVRRMPQSDARIFGADRAGDRPIECRHGHCGVDLGGEIWGEHVHAAHDGVVDWVQRGPNEERGGQFVRLSHRGGTVFTQYFHLAAIPRRLAPGVPVKAGDVIGLLGDTGVKESTAHLHFTISVRPGIEWPEQYMDPEPLIALWPLRMPFEGSAVGLVTTVATPGVPLGPGGLKSSRKHNLAKRRQARDAAAKSDKVSPGEKEPAVASSPSE